MPWVWAQHVVSPFPRLCGKDRHSCHQESTANHGSAGVSTDPSCGWSWQSGLPEHPCGLPEHPRGLAVTPGCREDGPCPRAPSQSAAPLCPHCASAVLWALGGRQFHAPASATR